MPHEASSNAQGGGGSFKDRKPIDSWQSEPMDRKVVEALSGSLSLSFSICLLFHLLSYLSDELSPSLSMYLSISLYLYLSHLSSYHIT
jgi:hypothetical protein